MGAQLGMNAQILYQTDGIGGSAGWTVLGNCTDVSFDMSQEEADVTTRGGDGWKASVGTLKAGKISFTMIWDTADTSFNDMSTAFLTNLTYGFSVLDRADSETAVGLAADMVVLNFSREEPLTGPITATVELSVTYSEDPPEWVTGGTAGITA